MTALAVGDLALFVNVLTALLGLTVIAGYLLVFSPLKTRTTLSTALGAFSGAMRALIGWRARRGQNHDDCAGGRRPGTFCERADGAAGPDGNRGVSVGLYTAEDAHNSLDRARRFSASEA